MSASSNKTVEGRNAYLTINYDCNSENKVKKRSDDSLYLTAKSPFRTRSCSPSVFKSIEPLATCSSVNPTTITPFTSASSLLEPNVIASSAQKSKIQVGMDRYITVLKRGRSPKSSKISSASKISREEDKAPQTSQNRFALLQDVSNEPNISSKSSRPPPIYLREKNSNGLVKKIISVIGEKSFYVVPLKRGNIEETKIQTCDEQYYRKLTEDFDKNKMVYYTYQLKSAKGMQVVLKGIDSCVEPEEVKSALMEQGYKVKHVINVINREKIPQPLFRVELEPNDTKLKKNEIHPIYNLKYLLHRKITVEEPHKRSGPVQCHNCQEYGHTKSYCKLPTVCVVCGELHGTANCNKPRDDQKHKKCSNCGGNHTANYRGCPVYSFVKQSMTQQQKITPAQTQNINAVTGSQMSQPRNSYVSYAAAVKTNPGSTNDSPTNNSNTNSGFNFNRLEATIDSLVQTINNFTTSMTTMMQEMLRMQTILLQAIVNKP